MEKSKTQRALDIFRQQPHRSMYSINKEVGLKSDTPLSRALRLIRDREDAARELARNTQHEPD